MKSHALFCGFVSLVCSSFAQAQGVQVIPLDMSDGVKSSKVEAPSTIRDSSFGNAVQDRTGIRSVSVVGGSAIGIRKFEIIVLTAMNAELKSAGCQVDRLRSLNRDEIRNVIKLIEADLGERDLESLDPAYVLAKIRSSGSLCDRGTAPVLAGLNLSSPASAKPQAQNPKIRKVRIGKPIKMNLPPAGVSTVAKQEKGVVIPLSKGSRKKPGVEFLDLNIRGIYY